MKFGKVTPVIFVAEIEPCVPFWTEKLGWKVKPLVRFIKAWKYFKQVPISSFYLELRVAKYADGESSIVYYIDVERILAWLWDIQLAALQDEAAAIVARFVRTYPQGRFLAEAYPDFSPAHEKAAARTA